MESLKHKLNGLTRSSEFNEKDIDFLEEVVTHFPYFHMARFTLARALFINERLGFKKHLKILSLQSNNRFTLYETFEKGQYFQKEIDTGKTVSLGNITFSLPQSPGAEISEAETYSTDTTGIDSPNEYSQYHLENENTEKRQKTRTSELIDGFLANPPKRIEGSNTYDQKHIKDDSLEIPEDLVSETLAKIYLKQNKPKEAIEIYEKLSLMEPEKKPKFAGLIREIKNKLE